MERRKNVYIALWISFLYFAVIGVIEIFSKIMIYLTYRTKFFAWSLLSWYYSNSYIAFIFIILLILFAKLKWRGISADAADKRTITATAGLLLIFSSVFTLIWNVYAYITSAINIAATTHRPVVYTDAAFLDRAMTISVLAIELILGIIIFLHKSKASVQITETDAIVDASKNTD